MLQFMKAGALAASVAVGLFGAGATAADATTISFGKYQSGEDLGNVQLATLDATQSGNDVLFVLTNTTAGQASSFISQLLLTYVGTLPTALSNVAGKAASSFATGSFNNASLKFQIDIGWPVNNQNNGVNRLKPGQSSTFKLLNTTLAGFFQGDSAMIHVQGLNSGGSTKYVPAATVPVPAAGLLLAGALGALGFARRRKLA